MSAAVRPARPDDVAEILRLIRALATYERQPEAVEATEASLLDTFFAPDARVYAHVAETKGRIVGVAVWFLNYSTWTGRPGIYLEDLVVDEDVRGSGAGRALFDALGREARARGCARIDWAVLDWNRPAMNFYRAIGGRPQTGWQPWRLDGPELETLGE
ncbi:GNAT family N-acetyltransferase [Sphingomonas nostoxanthinifaciens]|uniref:GNAT family N-acetyltransferase n=1 Tax=Sphingomonas nostoxanthinifaciens TaxID=2872652 RepID=UPI001CC21565|nr:GNAT family N-acetyltransferase [Sphingomonas nostoxanthinifaciens]UAK23074.1 GNAT family N-acetyltransferase [Sphingomonas nostoxanthinifaciens]